MKIKNIILVISFVAVFIIGIFLGPLIIKPSQGYKHLNYTHDWVIEGPTAPMVLARDKGFFEEQGVTVTIDRGYGAADSIKKVAAGVYDVGYASFDALVKFLATQPGQVIGVYMTMNVAPYNVFVIKGRGIDNPKDLEGRKVAYGAGEATYEMFPVFCERYGVDKDKINWIPVEFAARGSMLKAGELDAILQYTWTGYNTLTGVGVPEEDIEHWLYDTELLFGNVVIVNKNYMDKNPDAVNAFLRAYNKAIKYVNEHRDEAIETLYKYYPIINKDIERRSLNIFLDTHVFTPYSSEHGLGYADSNRINAVCTKLSEILGITKVSSEVVFTDQFLPPFDERKTT